MIFLFVEQNFYKRLNIDVHARFQADRFTSACLLKRVRITSWWTKILLHDVEEQTSMLLDEYAAWKCWLIIKLDRDHFEKTAHWNEWNNSIDELTNITEMLRSSCRTRLPSIYSWRCGDKSEILSSVRLLISN